MKLILTQTLKNYKFAFEDLETEGKVGGGGVSTPSPLENSDLISKYGKVADNRPWTS